VVLTGIGTGPTATSTLATTAPVRLGVRLTRASVSPGATQKVTVTRLLPGEKVKVIVNGRKVAGGTADASGRFVTSSNTTRSRARQRVVVTGGDRSRCGVRSFTRG